MIKIKDSVMVFGDIHGQFKTLLNYLKRKVYTDLTVIVAGDCGFGFEKFEHYEHLYNYLKKDLEKYDLELIFVRGNHDDPAYFENELINFPRFRTVKDYTLLYNDKSKILCIGGGISVDRVDRILNKSYWIDEPFQFKPELMQDCTHLITHSCFPPMNIPKNIVDYYAKLDKDLLVDLENERELFYNLKDYIEGKNVKWYCGHFHTDIQFNDVTYIKDLTEQNFSWRLIN
jgi:UDP-2,3-diacylglucosamine pyrophosphatase LpxH